MLPDVRAASSGMPAGAEDIAYFVILKTRREHVGGAVATGIDDENDRTLVDLADVIAGLAPRARTPVRECSPDLHRFLGRGFPFDEFVFLLLAHARRQRGIAQGGA